MRSGMLLGLAVTCSIGGIALLALAMDVHWRQAWGSPERPARRVAFAMRGAGAAALIVALALCLRADHASMAVLVWVMSLALASLLVALALAWWPRWLRRTHRTHRH